MPSILPNLTPLRKASTKRVFRPDEIDSTAFKNLEMKDLSQLNESAIQYLDIDYLYSTNEDNIVLYKIEKTEDLITTDTESNPIDENLERQLYFKGCSLPLPVWSTLSEVSHDAI